MNNARDKFIDDKGRLVLRSANAAVAVPRLWLAPMAGYTDIAFRRLCRECGCGFAVSEMVSVRGLVRDSKKTAELMRLAPQESPSCIQLFGSSPQEFAQAARMCCSDVIDINMGCPMPKVVKNDDGAALMKKPDKVYEIVKAAAECGKPITVKTRLGYYTGKPTLFDVAQAAASGGAAAITVHARYAEQRYSGECDYSQIVELAKTSPIPVVVNGDITTAQKAEEFLSVFAAVAIGRGAISSPLIFGRNQYSTAQIARRHLQLLSEYFDERYSINQARKFFVHYFKGVKNGKEFRQAVNCAESVAAVYAALDKYFAE